MKKDSYLVEKDLIHFRRATKDDDFSQIANLIYETDPYDASTVQKNGSFRGLTKTVKDGFKLES